MTTTESELKEKKLRIEDALNATKAAVEEGIILFVEENIQETKQLIYYMRYLILERITK